MIVRVSCDPRPASTRCALDALRLSGRKRSSLQHRGEHCIVGGQLLQATASQKIGAGIAHIADYALIAIE